MTVRRLVSGMALLAAFGLVAGFSAPTGAQEKKDKDKPAPKPATKPKVDEPTAAILTLIDEAMKAHDYRKAEKVGGGVKPYEELPSKPAILIGFNVYPGRKDKTTDYVRGIKPVWLRGDGERILGKAYGWIGDGSGMVQERAKDGYAVAGIKANNFFDHIQGISVVYAKITDTGLDMSDSYESKYYGHADPTKAREYVCTGEPVIGVHGMIADNYKSDHFGLGLIVLGKDGGKKKKK
jgi:hypothetical protein